MGVQPRGEAAARWTTLLCLALASSAVHGDRVKIVFGSCNKQNLQQRVWSSIAQESADAFVWTGDAVYAYNQSLAGLKAAYEMQKANVEYNRAMSHIPIVTGVWDDHDLGVNDGGMHVKHKKERQELYLDFVHEPPDSQVRVQDGLYRSIKLGTASHLVTVILLDTRSHRQNHIIPSVGTVDFPFSAVLAALTRLFSAVSGLTSYHTGDVLGEEQWLWLEQQLQASDAQIHVLVSSIQIATTNPLVESWGHFPRAKQRLLQLMQKYDPPGLVFVSGDVHHAELSDIKFQRDGGVGGRWKELTSSGLTHSCSQGWILGWTCGIMLDTFAAHRQQPLSYYTLPNYGVLEVDFNENARDLCTSAADVRMIVKDINGTAVLSAQQIIDCTNTNRAVADVEILQLPAYPTQLIVTLIAVAVIPVYMLMKRMFK